MLALGSCAWCAPLIGRLAVLSLTMVGLAVVGLAVMWLTMVERSVVRHVWRAAELLCLLRHHRVWPCARRVRLCGTVRGPVQLKAPLGARYRSAIEAQVNVLCYLVVGKLDETIA